MVVSGVWGAVAGCQRWEQRKRLSGMPCSLHVHYLRGTIFRENQAYMALETPKINQQH